MRYTSCQNITPAEIRIFIGRKKACDHERDRVYMSKHVTGFNQSKHSLAVGDGINDREHTENTTESKLKTQPKAY